MADRRERWPENASGRYYVDRSCIASKCCVAEASEHFAMSDDGHAYVRRQPQTTDEAERCRRALAACPVDAIGEDGETA
ncbi:MAG: ferredoxin [Candidatus Rokuibacteriota bacterium]